MQSKTAHSKTTKSRKVRTKHHRGKGSGTKHRARAHTRSQDERTQRRLQREMSRRKPESKRREKTRVQLAKSYAKTTRRRSDTTHKASKWLVDSAAVLRIETLKVIALSRGWAGKGVLRAQLSALLRQLEYKAKWYGNTSRESSLELPLKSTVLALRTSIQRTHTVHADVDLL